MRYDKVKALQRLLINSFSCKVIAVRRVTKKL
ncbi:reverse transcriptase N-terminal domain-containing protein [Orientia tsutsugamushi]